MISVVALKPTHIRKNKQVRKYQHSLILLELLRSHFHSAESRECFPRKNFLRTLATS